MVQKDRVLQQQRLDPDFQFWQPEQQQQEQFVSSAGSPQINISIRLVMGFSMQEIVEAYIDCRKGKSSALEAQAFNEYLPRNLQSLHAELNDRSYTIGKTKCFVVTKPRPREVWAACFRDRVVHHVLYNRVAPRFHASFSAGSCACIPGRGTLYGANRLEKMVRRVTENWKIPGFYLKLDLSNFFVSIHKPTLFYLLTRKITEDDSLWLTEKILFHNPVSNTIINSGPALFDLIPQHKSLFYADEDFGLPIGNLSSQFFVNVYLDALDKFCEHQVKPMGYVRYVDDFILLHHDRDFLVNAKARIEAFLAEHLRAAINPKKTILQPISRGVDFVGQVIKPWRRVSRGRLSSSAQSAARHSENKQATINSYLGLLRQTSSFIERLRLCRTAQRLGFSVAADASKTVRLVRLTPALPSKARPTGWLEHGIK